MHIKQVVSQKSSKSKEPNNNELHLHILIFGCKKDQHQTLMHPLNMDSVGMEEA